MTFRALFGSLFSPPLGPTVSSVSYLFLDTFTGADTTLITAHTPDYDAVGGGWVGWPDTGGTSDDYTIVSNRAKRSVVTAAVGDVFIAANVNDADVLVSGVVQINNINNATSGMALRLTNADNYWLMGIARTNLFRLLEKQTGSYTVRASAAVTINAATDYTIVGTTSGNSISGTLNGANNISYSSTFNNSATRHGLALRDLNDIADTFQVDP